MKNYTKFYFISILTLLTSCTSNDRDDNELDLGSNPDVEVHDFIWTELNQYYFWQEEVENLADSKKMMLSNTKAIWKKLLILLIFLTA